MSNTNWDATIQTNPQSMELPHTGRQTGCLVRIHPMDLDNNMIRLSQASMLIGRDPNCDLFLDDTSISRRHAEIRNTDNGFVLVDHRSTNGTFVDDLRVTEQKLENGARVRFGSHIFKFLANDCIEAQYHETVYSMMTRDGLTGAYNKRYLLELLQREFDRAHRYERPLSIVMMDIDFFKQVNDTYGHLAGDEVLQEFARRGQEVFRTEHVFARYGGEEFSLLMSEAPLKFAVKAAERFREAIAETPFETSAGPLPVTVSLGVAQLDPLRDTAFNQLLSRADDHLYHAKKNGRNQVYAA